MSHHCNHDWMSTWTNYWEDCEFADNAIGFPVKCISCDITGVEWFYRDPDGVTVNEEDNDDE